MIIIKFNEVINYGKTSCDIAKELSSDLWKYVILDIAKSKNLSREDTIILIASKMSGTKKNYVFK